jgi:hypothetical protein
VVVSTWLRLSEKAADPGLQARVGSLLIFLSVTDARKALSSLGQTELGGVSKLRLGLWSRR